MSKKQQKKRQGGYGHPITNRHEHRGGLVQVGPYKVAAYGTMYQPLPSAVFQRFDVIVPLNGKHPTPKSLREGQLVLDAELPDFGGVPEDWEQFLEGEVIPLLMAGNTMLAYCSASHGRTGTFLASLIALLEDEEETPDPIAAVRARHCLRAVESWAQAEGIFALRGQPIPEHYQRSMFH
jgi:hypothetical protein